ncbi:hypothetical protein ACQKEK_02285 [Pseudomonas sp. NPDC077408]|uniref:hypothetical protein n=1 Tax=Streptomyces parvus TaxID=66428 RepID=UPI00370FBC82
MNDTLKAASRIGAELGAVKAECERLRGVLAELSRAPQEGEVLTRERLAAICEVGHDRPAFVAALSQQAEPVDPAPAQDERERKEFERAYAEYADMDASEVASKWDGDLYSEQEVRDAWWGWTTRPAQTEQQSVAWRWVYSNGGTSPVYQGSGPDHDIEQAGLAAEFPRRVQRLFAAPIAQTAPQPEQSDIEPLLNAGAALSNIAFNLAQRLGVTLDQHVCDVLSSSRKAWDDARSALSAQRGDA